MTLKLYKVQSTYIVAAINQEAAKHVAPQITSTDLDIEEVTDPNQLPPGWSDALPFGGDGHLSCMKILADLGYIKPTPPYPGEALPPDLFKDWKPNE